GKDTQNLVFTVHGTADSAVIAGTDTGTVTEESQLHTSGALTISDKDDGEAHFTDGDIAAAHGTLHLKADGSWTYDLDNSNTAVQALGNGDTLTEVITVKSTDGTSHDITVTVNGTNDQPTVNAAVLTGAQEDTHFQMTAAQFGFQDSDHSDQLKSVTITDVPDPSEGQFLLNGHPVVHGQTIDRADIQHLEFAPAQDFNGDVHFKYTLTDTSGSSNAESSEASGVISVTPVDDKSVITATSVVGSVTEDGAQTASGTITITDVDKLDTPSFPDVASTATRYGAFAMKNGQWTYTLDNAKAQALSGTDTVEEKFTFTASDGSNQEVKVTVHGTEDKPVIESAHAAPVSSGASTLKLQDVHIVSNPTGANIDLGATASETAAMWGGDQLGAPAGYQLVGLYKPGSDQNFLSDHATVSTAHSGIGGYSYISSHNWWASHNVPDTVNTGSGGASGHGNAWTNGIAVFDDGHGNQMIGVINRVCSGGNGERDYLYYHSYKNLHPGALVLSGDANAGETITVKDGANVVGTASADANGHWEFSAAALSDGQHTLHVENQAGEASAERTYEITGSLVKDTTPAGVDAELKEDSSISSLTGELRVTDADGVDHPTIDAQASHATKYGHFEIDGNGVYHYTIDNSNPSVNALGVHQTLSEVVVVTARTGDGEVVHQNVTITINGSVDAPQLSGSASTAQQGALIDLNLNASLTDTGGDPESLTLKISGLPSSATLNHGTYDNIAKLWTLNAQDLTDLKLDMKDPNFHGDLHFNVTATASSGGESKSTTQTVSLHVNAPPEVASALKETATEGDAAHSIDLLSGVSDVDSSHFSVGTLSYQVDGGPANGTLPAGVSLAADGHTLVVDTSSSAFDHLRAGETQIIKAVYTISDGDGGVVQQTATLTVTGTNDAPVIGAATGSVTDQTKTSASGTISIVDADHGESAFKAATGLTGQHGTLDIGSDGTWTYTLNSGDRVVTALSSTMEITDHVTVTTADGTTKVVDITIHGTNDSPVVSAVALHGTEDTVFSFTATDFGFTDADFGSALDHVTITQLPDPLEGQLLLDGNPVTSNQQIAASDLDKLVFSPAANVNGDVHFGYKVSDGDVDSAEATATIQLAGTPDAAVIVDGTPSRQTIKEDSRVQASGFIETDQNQLQIV
ncbi:MAG: cadherin-like domain-containing protein, partial [Gammaproteobacteria bacterium]|nr:cadherin-like domain-containing protein [Gammaproteobacteria bacterium]